MQPLLEPRGRGVTAFLTRRFGTIGHVLAHACVEAGVRGVFAGNDSMTQGQRGRW